MSITVASEILDEVRASYLNDPDGGTYTNVKLLPCLRNAYGVLQSSLEANGVQCKNEEYIRTVPANTDELIPLPNDIVIPRTMFERAAGTDDEWTPVDYYNNIPLNDPSSTIICWTWRGDRLLFLKSTTTREVKLIYQRAFPALVASDVMLFGKSEEFLKPKTAAFAHIFLTESPTKAKAADEIAERVLTEIISTQVKSMQKMPGRRLPYVPGYRR